jgi:hypothetical protein
MDTLVFQQFLRELTLTGSAIVFAYFFVGGLIFVEKRIKRRIIHSALK